MPAKKSGPGDANVRVKLRFPASRLASLDANCKIACMSRDDYFDQLLDLALIGPDRHQSAESRPKEEVVEFTFQLSKVRLDLVDTDCERLDITRNRYFDRLFELAPIALDRHLLAEGIASLQFQLWHIQRLADERRLDRDLAQAIVKTIDVVARKITRKLRLAE